MWVPIRVAVGGGRRGGGRRLAVGDGGGGQERRLLVGARLEVAGKAVRMAIGTTGHPAARRRAAGQIASSRRGEETRAGEEAATKGRLLLSAP